MSGAALGKAPDEFDGEIYYYAFHTYDEALEFSNTIDGSEEPLVLIKQHEWVDEPETGKFTHETGERLTEWRVEWLNIAANKGHTNAQYFLGYCYFEGEYLKKDSEKGMFWLTIAATNGHKEAQKYVRTDT
ncbi:tetratricopeptide repeat protein [Shewanella sp. KX20019]|uniref:tetratricopeptide repeat protein n=1 Tax=Shewanella sp. KX20019 TaxID=2803864 RepID=UPI001F39A8F4|nr:hypothetical protein [Shewanella sp. KX20019]